MDLNFLKYYKVKYHSLASIIQRFDKLVLKEFRMGAPEGPYVLEETNHLLSKLRLSESQEPDLRLISQTLNNMNEYLNHENFRKTQKSENLSKEILKLKNS